MGLRFTEQQPFIYSIKKQQQRIAENDTLQFLQNDIYLQNGFSCHFIICHVYIRFFPLVEIKSNQTLNSHHVHKTFLHTHVRMLINFNQLQSPNQLQSISKHVHGIDDLHLVTPTKLFKRQTLEKAENDKTISYLILFYLHFSSLVSYHYFLSRLNTSYIFSVCIILSCC